MIHFLKGILFLHLLLLFSGSHLQAQTFEASALAGFNMAQVDGDDMVGFNRIGLNGGVQVSANLNERWQLSLGFIFSQQGSSRSKADPFGPYDHIRLNYLEAPVLFHFKEWKLLVTAGASYARLINYTSISLIGEDITDLERYKPGLVYYILGATLKMNERFGVNIQYSKSIGSFQDDEAKPKLFNRMVTVRGVYFL